MCLVESGLTMWELMAKDQQELDTGMASFFFITSPSASTLCLVRILAVQ